MVDVAAEHGRLTPIFAHVRDESMSQMEGLNPERARRLLQPRSPSMSPIISVGPQKTGSNTLALGGAAAHKPTSVKQELSPSWNGGAQALVHIPKHTTSVIAGNKRPHDCLEDVEPYQQQEWCLNPPTLPPPPPPNPHTVYLESLLKPHCLLLTVKSRRGDGSYVVATQYRSISNAGLLLTSVMQCQLDLPILQLPAPGQVNGGLERMVEGELLEEIWYDLTPEAKYAYARQLRHILNNMRTAISPVRNVSTAQIKKSLLGSAFAGPYSLMLDQHVQNTYWAVRVKPTCRQFVAFLASSFVPSVPANVVTALTCQFRPDYAIRFTHGELSPRNIIVQNSKIVCILGWDSGGWYPEWWEYVKFFEARTSHANQDWYDYANHIFADAYPNELVAYQGIARCQRQ
ncbi:phosphotransferase [Trichoderma arundinaceum]|uniref:Phosphotransferase n=1 Tax=Trichoderma arundinaceum TaxID=490622 RepID=A0A395NDQ6_TRIAR|nr:phosphotransferase [Trichoderma arundinaceum]